jgi:hypothetical protein
LHFQSADLLFQYSLRAATSATQVTLTNQMIGVAPSTTLMGMESPDTRRKADDSYRARCAGRSLRATGLVALTEGKQMAGLPPSLSIAFWFVGSIWLVAIVAHVLDAPHQIVHAALAFGVVAGVVEWLAVRGSKR